MTSFLAVLVLGLLLGARHATDPDHVVAITTIVVREKSLPRSAMIGILWGLGHTLMILLVGGAIILFGLVIPPRLGLSMEFSVALMLVALGAFNLNAFWQSFRHSASNRTKNPRVHSHFRAQESDARIDQWGAYRMLRPLAVGVVHGMAGSAAIALVILATIRNPIWAMVYLMVFGLGTIIGMVLITAAIATPSVYGTRRIAWANRHLVAVSGLFSCAFGLFLAYRISVINGLFTSHPVWVPK